MIKKTSIFTIILAFAMSVCAQIDTEFWFAAPDLEINHAQVPIYFCITSYDEPANVTFTQPANPDFEARTFHLDANSFGTYNVSDLVDILETKPYNTVLNYGLHITSDALVSVYYESNNDNSEIYTLKGTNALGCNFIVPTQLTYENRFSSTCSRAEFVATENNTEVTIIPSVNLKDGIMAGQQIVVVLNKGQSYAVEAASNYPAGHIGGTRIKSNKPIAVNTSDDSVYLNGCYDLVGDQLVPVEMLGEEYIAVKNGENDEFLYFYPVENETNIYLNGNPIPLVNIGINDRYEYKLTDEVTFVKSDKPIAVFQLTSYGYNEQGGTVLPQIHCTGSLSSVCRRPNTGSLIVSIVVKSEFTNGFLVNGDSTMIPPTAFVEVPSSPEYSYCKVDLSNQIGYEELMKIENTDSEGYFQLGVLFSNSSTCTYGFFSDYNAFSKVVLTANATEYCAGDDVVLNYKASNASDVKLIVPDGTTHNTFPFIIQGASGINSGRYYVKGIDETGCFDGYLIDSVDIKVIQPQMEIISEEIHIKKGESAKLWASGADSYEWSPAEGLSDVSSASPLASPESTTMYTVIGSVYEGDMVCEATASVIVYVDDDQHLLSNSDSATSLYPNPASDFVTVKAKDLKRVRVFNAAGQLMIDVDAVGSEQYQLDLHPLPKSMYIIEIQKDNELIIERLSHI